MNGPLSMYRLKPVVHFSDAIALTPTMYRMKNIYSSTNSSLVLAGGSEDACVLPNVLEQVNKLLKQPSLEIEDLKKRQEVILKQLTYLKEQMLALREELNKKNTSSVQIGKQVDTSTSHQKVAMEPTWSGVIGEIVIHASPDSPPYSLLAVNQLWPEALRVQVSCHTHSSVTTLHPELSVFSLLALTSSPTLKIRLIWKEIGPDCEMVVSPLTHCPIRGEVNLLRYLYRTICTADSLALEVQQDSTLDLCHRLSHARTLRDKQLLVRTLNSRLADNTWIGGDSLSIVDVAAWSVLRSVSGVDLSKNMTRWQTRCGAAFGVEAA